MNNFDLNSLKTLKNSSRNALTKLRDKKGGQQDDRFWKLEIDPRQPQSTATIRILPSLHEGELPWVEEYRYFINGNNGTKYYEKSLRSIGKADPMAEYISHRWNTAHTEEEKAQLRKANLRKPSKTYIANVYIVDDPAHQENNGKVKLFRFGQTVYNKIIQMAEAPLAKGMPGDTNVTDWETGCNLILIGTHRDGSFPSYDQSLFSASTAIDDASIVSIANQMHDLREFSDEKTCKSREALISRIKEVFPDSKSFFNVQGGMQEEPIRQYGVQPNQYGVETPYQMQEPVAPMPPQVEAPVAPKANAKTPWDDEEFDFDALMADVK